MGHFLGIQARKPFRQAKWVWSWFAGSESESLQAEQEYGRECAREFAAQFSGKVSPASQELVDAVGVRLAGAVKDPRRLHLIVAGGMGPVTAVCHGWNDSSVAVHGTYQV